MGRFQDLTGYRFGDLTVQYLHHKGRDGRSVWQCTCVCGGVAIVFASNLKRGHSTSCGCKKGESHGEAEPSKRTAEYATWRHIITRCTDTNDPTYPRYGGRGIKMCDRWRDSYLSFLSDMGRRPSDWHSIDRIDNNGDYEPANCKWSTAKEQANNRRSNRIIEFAGLKMNLNQWAIHLGISRKALSSRFHRGEPIEKMLTGSRVKVNKNV